MRFPRPALILLALLLSAGLTLGACGGDGDTAVNGDTNDITDVGGNDDANGTSPAGGGERVTLEAKEFEFSPASITIAAGEATSIELKNAGSLEHDFTVDDPDFQVFAAATKTATRELTIDEPGEYAFYCSVPGHREAGMEGTLLVE